MRDMKNNKIKLGLLVVLPYLSLCMFYLKYVFKLQEMMWSTYDSRLIMWFTIISYLLFGIIISFWLMSSNEAKKSLSAIHLIVFIILYCLLYGNIYTSQMFIFIGEHIPVLATWCGIFVFSIIKNLYANK